MHLLSPAQFVFVLWLLTAAAPTATLLLNGAMLPIVSMSARVEAAGIVESKVQRFKVQSLPFHPAARSAENIGLWAVGLWTPRVSASVLHTGVQRHRPRVA